MKLEFMEIAGNDYKIASLKIEHHFCTVSFSLHENQKPNIDTFL